MIVGQVLWGCISHVFKTQQQIFTSEIYGMQYLYLDQCELLIRYHGFASSHYEECLGNVVMGRESWGDQKWLAYSFWKNS